MPRTCVPNPKYVNFSSSNRFHNKPRTYNQSLMGPCYYIGQYFKIQQCKKTRTVKPEIKLSHPKKNMTKELKKEKKMKN